MDVIVVGSCMTDFVSYVPRLPKPGETLHGTRFVKNFGGKGANQCIVAARLGARTTIVAKVGTDVFGNDYLENFKNNGVATDHVGQSGSAATGVATIAVEESGQNSIVIVGGANQELRCDDVNDAESDLSKARVLVCQLEVPLATTLHALHLARKHGVVSIFNPAPAQSELPEEAYRLCDVFCPNQTEAELLWGHPVDGVASARAAVAHFLSRGVCCVVITLGEEGAVMGAAAEDSKAGGPIDESNMQFLHVPAPSVTVVDTTGAGDAFVGALAYFLSRTSGESGHVGSRVAGCLDKCVRLASISVQACGTQPSFPWAEDIPPGLL